MNGSINTPLPLYANASINAAAAASSPPTSPLRNNGSNGNGTTAQVTLSRKRTHRLRGGSSSSGSWRKSGHLASGFPSLLHDGGARDGHGNSRQWFSSSRIHALIYARNSPLAILRPSNLTARARTTNLAVLLLVLALGMSLLYNVRYYLHEHALPYERDRLPLSIRATLPQSFVERFPAGEALQPRHRIQGVKQELADRRANPKTGPVDTAAGVFKTSANAESLNLANLYHLIIVPGHAVWKGRSAAEAHQDDYWVLEPIQKGGGVQTFIKHVMKGAQLAVADPNSLLVFSGGQTRTTAQETEGDSYYRLAEALDLYRQFGSPKRPGPDDFATAKAGDVQVEADTATSQERADNADSAHESTNGATSTAKDPKDAQLAAQPDRQLFPRATTEQFALDSYQNLLFSICRFKEYVACLKHDMLRTSHLTRLVHAG